MQLFIKRLDRYAELIRQGDLQGAIKRMKIYVHEGIRLDSDLARLFATIQTFDRNMDGAIKRLMDGEKKEALDILKNLKEKGIPEIHAQAKALSKQELKFEK